MIEFSCPACGHGCYSVRDNSDAPIPIHVPPSVHDDEGRPVGQCAHCDRTFAVRTDLTLDVEFPRLTDVSDPVDVAWELIKRTPLNAWVALMDLTAEGLAERRGTDTRDLAHTTGNPDRR